MMAADSATDEPEGQLPPEHACCEADLKRAIAAAQDAGLRAYRIEIAPDGTISIIVGAAQEPQPPSKS